MYVQGRPKFRGCRRERAVVRRTVLYDLCVFEWVMQEDYFPNSPFRDKIAWEEGRNRIEPEDYSNSMVWPRRSDCSHF